MTTTENFQVSVEAAELYEATFVPAIFAEWAPLLVDIAGSEPGQSVLDVACGTGIVARTVADRLAGTGRVVGVDLNDGMLAVARRVRPDLDWRQGDVGRDCRSTTDRSTRVLCQMALMFFPDRAGALREMARVGRPGGVVALCGPRGARRSSRPTGRSSTWRSRVAGPRRALPAGTYWACGDLDELRGDWSRAAGLEVIDVADPRSGRRASAHPTSWR